MQSTKKLSLVNVVQWLVEDGMVFEDKLSLINSFTQNQTLDNIDLHPFNYIVQRKWQDRDGTILTMEHLMQWLSRRTKIPYYHIDPLKIDVGKITKIISHSYADFFNILPIKIDQNTVIVATAEPFDLDWQKEITRITRKQARLVLAKPDDIRRYIKEFFQVAKSVFGANLQSEKPNSSSSVQNFEQLLELGKKGELDSNDHHIVNLVDWLLQYAFEQRASDIHLEPRRDVGNIRFRIDGKMQKVYEVPSLVMAAVSSRIKILARMNVAEKRRPQDGRIKTRDPDGNEIELRLSTMPTAFGEKLVMRIFDPNVLNLDYKQLGFSPQNENNWQELINKPHGLILVTGPTGSGKTSTLYTSLKQLSKPDVNVCTVEDPIEMVEDTFNQMQVQEQINVSFADGIRTLLRQDPDIIMVGEIRDYETAEMAIQASLTGHLVLSTLHTNDSASAVIRLLDLGIPHYLIKTSLLGVMAQRLVRTLCPHCKAIDMEPLYVWKDFVAPYIVDPPENIYKPVGCQECRNTGFIGRTGIYEILAMNEKFNAIISSDTNLDVFRETIKDQGIETMKLSAINKIIQGLTTIPEVIKVLS